MMCAWSRIVIGLVGVALVGGRAALAQAVAGKAPASVSVVESDPTYRTGWRQGHEDHKWEERRITLDSGAVNYAIKYSSCVDASHPGVRVSEEGYIGMPSPSVANWYHSGFLFVLINGKDIGEVPLTDMRVTERGSRGGMHMVWDGSEATVCARFLVQAGSDHLTAEIAWVPKPGATVSAVTLRLVCYPSFFTAHHRRQGDRQVVTPRLARHEPETLELVPAEDTYLFYCDTVFDMARGEGEGPCALLFLPGEVTAGKVQIGNYAVTTVLTADPAKGRARLAIWDLAGSTNAAAATRLQETAASVQRELADLDFRPESVRRFDPVQAQADTARYLAQAGADAAPHRARVEGLLKRLVELKPRADAGDWAAAPEFVEVSAEFEAIMWKLRIQALLNAEDPGP